MENVYLPQFLFFCQVLSLSSCFLSHSPPCDRNHFWSPLMSSNRRRMFWWTASGKSFFAACLKRFQRFLSKWFGWTIIQKKTRWNSLWPWWALIDILESELVWLGNNSEEDKVKFIMTMMSFDWHHRKWVALTTASTDIPNHWSHDI